MAYRYRKNHQNRFINYRDTLQNVSLRPICYWQRILESDPGSMKESGLPPKSNRFLPVPRFAAPLHKISLKSVHNFLDIPHTHPDRRPLRSLLHYTRVFVFGAHHVNLNEDKPTLFDRKKSSQDSSFWKYKVYAVICGSSLERGRQTKWSDWNRLTNRFLCNSWELTGFNLANSYYIII